MTGSTKQKIDVDHALVLLVTEILQQLDELYALRKQGGKAVISHELLREMCSVLPELSEELQERYLDILISIATKKEVCSSISPSEDMVSASAVPKRKFIAMIAQKLGLKAA